MIKTLFNVLLLILKKDAQASENTQAQAIRKMDVTIDRLRKDEQHQKQIFRVDYLE